MAKIVYPEFARDRGVGYWLRPANLWASRRKHLRTDSSIAWRKTHTAALAPLLRHLYPWRRLTVASNHQSYYKAVDK